MPNYIIPYPDHAGANTTEVGDADEIMKARGVLEPVTNALEALCVGKGDVRSRLEDAVSSHLIHLTEENFPSGLGCRFAKIIQQSTKYDASDLYRAGLIPLEYLSPGNPHYKGRIQPTMRRIRRSTGSKIAREIWSLHCEVESIAEKHWE